MFVGNVTNAVVCSAVLVVPAAGRAGKDAASSYCSCSCMCHTQELDNTHELGYTPQLQLWLHCVAPNMQAIYRLQFYTAAAVATTPPTLPRPAATAPTTLCCLVLLCGMYAASASTTGFGLLCVQTNKHPISRSWMKPPPPPTNPLTCGGPYKTPLLVAALPQASPPPLPNLERAVSRVVTVLYQARAVDSLSIYDRLRPHSGALLPVALSSGTT